MINLAGNKDADKHIEEELYLAGIPVEKEKGMSIETDTNWAIHTDGSRSEVPYSITGRLSGWTFWRAWYYYVASCPDGLGLPYDIAVRMHEMKYPISSKRYSILGQVIRVDGHCGCPHPQTRRYSTLDSIEKECVEAKSKFPDIDFNAERTFDHSCLREIEGIKYIRLYHIDTQVGLNVFAGVIAH